MGKPPENQDIVQEDDAEDEEGHDTAGGLPENAANPQGTGPAAGTDKQLLPSASTLAHYSASIQALGQSGQSPMRNAVLHRQNAVDTNKS